MSKRGGKELAWMGIFATRAGIHTRSSCSLLFFLWASLSIVHIEKILIGTLFTQVWACWWGVSLRVIWCWWPFSWRESKNVSVYGSFPWDSSLSPEKNPTAWCLFASVWKQDRGASGSIPTKPVVPVFSLRLCTCLPLG